MYPNVFATPPAVIPRAIVDAMIMPDKAETPTTAQVVATFEHMLRPTLAITASGVYTHSWHKQFTTDTNLAWNQTLNGGLGGYARIDPNYRRITQLQLDAPAEYVGAIFEVEQRAARLGWTGNITFSKSRGVEGVDDLQTYLTQGFANDYGPQPDSPTVRGTVSGYFNVTTALQLSGSYRGRSGLPVNSVAAGVDLNGDGVLGDRTPTFRAYAFSAPANHTVDARLTWSFPVGGSRRLQTYVESYNLLNYENVRTVLNDYGTTPGTPKNRWLEPNLWFPPREVQFGARLAF